MEERLKRERRKCGSENRGRSDGIDGQLGTMRHGMREASRNWKKIRKQSPLPPPEALLTPQF